MWNNFMAPKIKKRKASRSKRTFSSDEEEQLQISYEDVDFATF